MQKSTRQSIFVPSFVVLLLVVDQVIKILVKTNMRLGEVIVVAGDWFKIAFTENNGMAFGMELTPKVFLTLFRIVAVGLIIWYVCKIIRRGVNWGYLACLSLILAGAIGNIIDCLFYGLIFSESTPYTVSHLVPFGHGYQTLMHGRVVDMFYFPLAHWVWPSWMPFCGGENFTFFSPIFNFADSCISVGIFILIIFYYKELDFEENSHQKASESSDI